MHMLKFILMRLHRSVLFPANLRIRWLRLVGVTIGRGFWMNYGVTIQHPRNLFIGDNVGISAETFLDTTGRITLHYGVRIGMRCTLITGTHTIRNSVIRRDPMERVIKPITIERGCWLGSCVIVQPGVTIREGCVIHCGSSVAHDTEPNGLYGGVPARRLRTLSTEEDRAEALALAG